LSENPGPVEELGDEPRPRWLGTPRRRRVVAALAVTVLLALAGARFAATYRSSHRAGPDPVPTPRPSTAPVGPTPVELSPGLPNFGKDDPAFCPLAITCRTVRSVPAGVLRAIRRILPSAGSMSGYTVLQVAPQRVHFRQVNASGNGVTVVILVSRAAAVEVHPTDETDGTGVASVGYVRAAIPGGYEVQVQFTALPGWTPPMAQIRALAADPRLLAVG
jgi:hypothetical protein